jgi:hypothetical protein
VLPAIQKRRRAATCRLGFASDKTHVEHNEAALALIAEIPGTCFSVAMGHYRN